MDWCLRAYLSISTPERPNTIKQMSYQATRVLGNGFGRFQFLRLFQMECLHKPCRKEECQGSTLWQLFHGTGAFLSILGERRL